MIRNLKALGLAVAAVLAMSAVVASAAQAGNFTAGASPADLTGEQVNSGSHADHSFTAGLRTVTCTTALFDGTENSPSSTLTITPTYSGCTSGTFTATVTLNGCDYVFNTPTQQADGTFTGTVNMKCANANDVIEVHIYSSHANHTSGSSICTITVKQFTGLSTNTYHNISGTPDHVLVTSTVSNIPVEIHGSSALVCGSLTTATTAVYNGSTTVKAYKHNSNHSDPKNQVNATVS